MILQIQSGTITARLRQGQKVLVENVSFLLREGESLALIGETGSGKTMTALAIMGLLPENVFQKDDLFLYEGQALSKKDRRKRMLGREIVYIPQNGLESLNPSRIIQNQFTDGFIRNHVPGRVRKEKALSLLKEVGFLRPEEILRKYPFELSGGMAQKVTIALAACGKAKLVLADEPTNGLDQAATREFFMLLDRLFPNAAKLIITHDISVAELCDRVVVLCGGKMCEKGISSDVLSNPRHPYTQALLQALVKNGMKETPILREGEGVCPFYARCPKADPACVRTNKCQDCIEG